VRAEAEAGTEADDDLALVAYERFVEVLAFRELPDAAYLPVDRRSQVVGEVELATGANVVWRKAQPVCGLMGAEAGGEVAQSAGVRPGRGLGPVALVGDVEGFTDGLSEDVHDDLSVDRYDLFHIFFAVCLARDF
jgi:hypothetical protein